MLVTRRGPHGGPLWKKVAHRAAEHVERATGNAGAGMTNLVRDEVEEPVVSASAEVASTAVIGAGSRVWDLAQVREDAEIGRRCVLGRGACVDAGVRIGDHVKIQNYALIYHPAELADGVFIGPSAVLTNDTYPRAVDVDGAPLAKGDWEPVGVTVREGASLGARSVCVAPVVVGRWALVGAGAVVVDDVPDFALVVGNPARRIGWVGPAGVRLETAGRGRWRCPRTGARFLEIDDVLREEGR